MKNISIEIIDDASPYLPDVKRLWRKNSDTLGFFPEGAFDEHAANKLVIVAVSVEKHFLGYLLYRTVRHGNGWPVAVIVHLCVASTHRGNNVAKTLVQSLCKLTKDNFLRIELKCRRDFDANRLWPKIGFTCVGEEIGRAGAPLGRWHLTFRELPLIALLDQKTLAKRFLAVIDNNILFRLQDPVPTKAPPHERLLHEEAKALLEDWLIGDVTLSITDEALNEIERHNDPNVRQRRRRFSEGFYRIKVSQEAQGKVYHSLENHFSGMLTLNSRSDIIQVSQAIAGDAYCFITQDTGVLRKAGVVEKEFGMKVLSPGEFVGHADEVIREIQYRPTALAGSRRLTKSIISSRLSADLYPRFRDSFSGERKTKFESQLRVFMAQPARYNLELCRQSSGEPLVLVVYDRCLPEELTIPLLRVAPSPFADTVLRYVLRQIVMTSFNEKRMITRIGDNSGNDQFGAALEEVGFSNIGGEWIKCNLPFIGNSQDLCSALNELDGAAAIKDIRDAIIPHIKSRDPVPLVDIERRLWPAKIMDTNIPNYIISIKAAWAQHLFDEDLAIQTLYGAKEETALRHENVYYRRYRYPAQVRSPGRILWYVMKDTDYRNSMQLKACSFLDEVVTGKAKDLFKRFQRLGIYEWRDILRDAGNPDNPLMALRFSNTEAFRSPINLQSVIEIVKKGDGKSLCLQSPQIISARSFEALYCAGMEIKCRTSRERG